MPSTVSNFKQPFKVFAFEPLHVSLEKTPLGQKALLMPVENLTINQTFSPTYHVDPAYGRMDPIVTYKSTTRSMVISFVLQAHHLLDSPDGVVNNIRNINLLTQLLYPAYFPDGSTINGDPTAVLGAPPFFRIRYGNYIGSFKRGGEFMGESDSGLTGYIESFSHKLGSIPKNVAFGKQAPDKGYRALPRKIDVGFTFKVIHDKLVGWYRGEFSPNGYGYNFPYNAGQWGFQATNARSAPQADPGSVETTVMASTTAPLTSMEDRATNPQGPQQKVAAAQMGTDLGKSPHTAPDSSPGGTA